MYKLVVARRDRHHLHNVKQVLKAGRVSDDAYLRFRTRFPWLQHRQPMLLDAPRANASVVETVKYFSLLIQVANDLNMIDLSSDAGKNQIINFDEVVFPLMIVFPTEPLTPAVPACMSPPDGRHPGYRGQAGHTMTSSGVAPAPRVHAMLPATPQSSHAAPPRSAVAFPAVFIPPAPHVPPPVSYGGGTSLAPSADPAPPADCAWRSAAEFLHAARTAHAPSKATTS